jgi:hypothetical protein
LYVQRQPVFLLKRENHAEDFIRGMQATVDFY